MAVHHGTDGSDEGCELYEKFSKCFPKYKEGEPSAKWRSFGSGGITVATLFHKANQGEPNWRNAFDAELEESLARANREGARIYEFPREYVGQNDSKAEARPSNGARDDAGQSNDTKSDAGSTQRPKRAIPLHWHGEQQAIAPRWLIRNRLPETGVALISGQWGTGKTFVLLDIAVAVILGMNFLGEPTRRRGGILIFAAEGASELPIRLAALAESKVAVPSQGDFFVESAQGKDKPQPIDPKRLPIVWADHCPPLSEKNLPLLVDAAETAARRLKEEYGLPLSIIGVDTMAAAASFKDENDNAEAQSAMNVLRQLSQKTGCLVIAVDHFGKVIKTGTRGASAKEAAADVVLALLGDREDEGGVADLRLCLRKVRGGPSGQEFPFELVEKDLGNDQDGYPIKSCIVEWTTQKQKSATGSQALCALDEALRLTFAEHKERVQPPDANKEPVEAVRLKVVRAQFEKLYGRNQKAAREAFRRAVKARSTLAKGVINGEEYLWHDVPF